MRDSTVELPVAPPVSLPLADQIAVLAAQLDSATHKLLSCIRLFDETEEWGQQGAQTCAHWLSWRIGLDLATAREKVRVARALGALPAIDKALAAGRLSYAKVRALTRVATPENDARLVDVALLTTGAQLERVCRGLRRVEHERATEGNALGGFGDEGRRSVSLRQLPDGMVRLEATLHPDEADLVMQAIEKARDTLRAQTCPPSPGTAGGSVRGGADDVTEATPDISAEMSPSSLMRRQAPRPGDAAARIRLPGRADGLLFMAEAILGGADSADGRDTPAGAEVPTGASALLSSEPANCGAKVNSGPTWGSDRYQVFIHLEQSVLDPDGTMGAFLDDGTRLSAEAFRRVACDGGLVALAMGGKGDEVRTAGRRTRAISPSLRRALWIRDRGCRFPSCSNRRYVHGHHIQHWAEGGATTKENLVLLCSFHHRLLHEGGFSIRRQSGEIQFLDACGRLVPDSPPVATKASVDEGSGDSSVILAPEGGLPANPEVNVCGWDGDPVDYEAVVDHLLPAEVRATALGSPPVVPCNQAIAAEVQQYQRLF